jgi:hypothetical protein
MRRYDPICSVDGCDGPHFSKGFCATHFYRVRHHGHPGLLVHPQDPICRVEGCGRESVAHSLCLMHRRREIRWGDPLVVGNQKETHPAWSGDAVSYHGAHRRIAEARGPARQFRCVDCPERAAQWSYVHSGIAERRDPRGLRYSTDVEQYDPRCVRCHSHFDNALRAHPVTPYDEGAAVTGAGQGADVTALGTDVHTGPGDKIGVHG